MLKYIKVAATSPEHLFKLYNPEEEHLFEELPDKEKEYWKKEYIADPFYSATEFIEDSVIRYINK